MVIVTWNTGDLLADALTSLEEQTGGVTYEVIVVDNGSVDGTSEMVTRRFPAVRLLSLPENLGFTGGNNRGFEIALGRYLLLLNSDTVVLPTTVAPLVRFLDDHPRSGCAGARHLNADGSLQRSMDDFPTLVSDGLSYTELLRVPAVDRWLTKRYAWWSDHEEQRQVGWVNGACMMVRREVYEQLGGFDEDLFIYGDELDWCQRMAKAGWTVDFVPSAEVIHLGGQAMDRAADRRTRLLLEGQLHFYRNHHERWRYLSLSALIAGTALVRLALIHVLWAADRLGKRPSDAIWELVTRERVRIPYRAMVTQWLEIFDLATHPKPS